CMQGKQFPWTF
nr:immunoglobulin light chain junction region [Macaca mulatta]MOV62067.1 immunoglobulin light chain junction region [Macaca mulatta]MOV62112.1 immunoglobulin light chain junction region [Macaca mulatta]MOV62124.1 immunoglobulin light chain junction region [Macaca mulatta]MOV65314.1 immunoglobulin light chain junction region [Macaca mulatta]